MHELSNLRAAVPKYRQLRFIGSDRLLDQLAFTLVELLALGHASAESQRRGLLLICVEGARLLLALVLAR